MFFFVSFRCYFLLVPDFGFVYAVCLFHHYLMSIQMLVDPTLILVLIFSTYQKFVPSSYKKSTTVLPRGSGDSGRFSLFLRPHVEQR